MTDLVTCYCKTIHKFICSIYKAEWQQKTYVKLPDDAACESSACECSSNFCRRSERVFDWCCDGNELAMSSMADVNFFSSDCSALVYTTRTNLHRLLTFHNLDTSPKFYWGFRVYKYPMLFISFDSLCEWASNFLIADKQMKEHSVPYIFCTIKRLRINNYLYTGQWYFQ